MPRTDATLKLLDERRAAALEALCDLIVPGSGRVGPVVYVDALLASMPPDAAAHALEAIDELEPASTSADALAERTRTPAFAFVRALAIEAYYSDFVAPGRDAPGAWSEIDFNSPLATRLAKDWSYLGIA
jgi:hypothetical protein